MGAPDGRTSRTDEDVAAASARTGLRELRLVVADPRSRAVRRRVAKQVAGLDRDREHDALKWIESVSKLDADATR